MEKRIDTGDKGRMDFSENRRFSVSLLPDRIRIYTCSRHDYLSMIVHFRLYDLNTDILSQTLLDDEISFFMYYRPEDPENEARHAIFTRSCTADPHTYCIADIHEDLPGIDHVGIIHYLSGQFYEKRIPILYINTFGHNLILIAEQYISNSIKILEQIAYCT